MGDDGLTIINQVLEFTDQPTPNTVLMFVNLGLRKVLMVAKNAMENCMGEQFDARSYAKVSESATLLVHLLDFIPTLAHMTESTKVADKLIHISHTIQAVTSEYMTQRDNSKSRCMDLFVSIGHILQSANYDGIEEYSVYLKHLGVLLSGQ